MLKLSVVMSVFNGQSGLARTLDSVLSQTFADFELIVVDDGSTDATASILAFHARRDSRIRILTQPNAGLTAALISGCSAARGELIARHDCGDLSRPTRFATQIELLRDDVVLVFCRSIMKGPNDELLYVMDDDGAGIRTSLLHDPVTSIHALHHGSAMFSRAAYQKAGGYRPQFRFAQDLDLWIRMAALGRVEVTSEVLFEARYEPGSLSGSRRKEQIALARIAISLRDEELTETERQEHLLAASRIRGSAKPMTRREEARALQFIASCLRKNGDPRSRSYALAALRRNPANVRAWRLFLINR